MCYERQFGASKSYGVCTTRAMGYEGTVVAVLLYGRSKLT